MTKHNAPYPYDKKSQGWIRRFNLGRNYGEKWTHKQNTPAIEQGCAFWTGWRHEVFRRGIKPPDNDNTFFVEGEDEIKEMLTNCALRPRQWQHWTGFSGPEDITALIVEVSEGEVVEMWATGSGAAWYKTTWFRPLPTQYWA